jgi:hypothetical protein
MDRSASGGVDRSQENKNIDATTVKNKKPGSNGESNYSNLDEAILNAQGHEAVLKRSFSLVSSLGIAFEYVSQSFRGPPEFLNSLADLWYQTA